MKERIRRARWVQPFLLACFCLWMPTLARAQAATEDVLMIKLRGGMFQWGIIEEHSAESLTFRRIDTGGVVIVPWSLIEPRQDLELRTQFGYVDMSSDEVMITAEKLILRDGRELIGLLKERTDDALLFLTAGRVLQIPKALVKDHIGGLQVPALDVKSKEKLYLDQKQSLDLESALAQYELGVYCERILDFGHALEHYLAARELDPSYKPAELDAILARVTVKVENQEQVDFLAHVDLLKRRDKFDEAFAELLVFDANFRRSPLAAERVKMGERIRRARDRFMHEEVSDLWFSWMGRLAANASRKLTHEETLAYLEEGFSNEIVTAVTQKLRKHWAELEEDQVRQFFSERKLGRWKPASYGLGTWLLGEEDALKGNQPKAEAPEKQSARDKQRSEEADKIQRWLRNQEQAKRSRKSDSDTDEIEETWTLLQSNARRNWIIAFYAEKSGDLMVRPKPELHNCATCGGPGTIDVIYTGSGVSGSDSVTAGVGRKVCPTCHGIGRVRRIRYR